MKYLKVSFPFAVIFFTIIFLSGCKKNDGVVNSTNNTSTVNDVAATTDAAYAVAANVSINNGGSLDEMSDVLNTATITGLQNEDMMSGMTNFGESHTKVVSKTYDSTSGWWTVILSKHRGNVSGFYYCDYSRVYKHQFLNKNNQPQEYYITNSDTAYSIKHQIVSGIGILKSPKQSHQLTALSGAFTVTGTNTNIVTLNSTSPYTRAVSDTMYRNNSVRTLNGTLVLNFANVVGPRGSGLKWHQKTSGTITGTYDAVVTFQKDTLYTEKTIHKTISITIMGSDPAHSNRQTAEIDVDNTKFFMDVDTGDIL
jgi:hypothetical protein